MSEATSGRASSSAGLGRAWRFDQAFLTLTVALFAVGAFGLLIGDGNTDFMRAGRVWLDGRSASGEPLWGRTVLWWARAGKVLQFAAGLVVILDLIGPERLRRAGQQMTARLRVVIAQLSAFRAEPDRTHNGAVLSAAGILLFGINLFLLILLFADWSKVTSTPLFIGPFVVAPIALLIFLALGRPEQTAGARFPLIGIGWLLAQLVLGVPAALLDKANPGHLVRWLGLLLFVIGFGLDLLGS
ncbi:hypothetical protein [Catellatospora sp. IY07-71]|uniref:hypothetical protein n=1 Tax=Catellatospora sp. IY07-71 TaxID=2728827 RepID=UPI001BB4512E|nr:hypothetical protein [Catellatospora sp. IY07-71]